MAMWSGECPFLPGEELGQVVPAMVRLLGTVTERNWPDHTGLAAWEGLARHNAARHERGLAAWLADRPAVQPLGPAHPAITVAEALLQWCPKQRASM